MLLKIDTKERTLVEMFQKQIEYLNGSVPKVKASYSVEEVCLMLGVVRQTVYKLIKQGCFKAIRIENEYRIIKKSFDCWLDGEKGAQ